MARNDRDVWLFHILCLHKGGGMGVGGGWGKVRAQIFIP